MSRSVIVILVVLATVVNAAYPAPGRRRRVSGRSLQGNKYSPPSYSPPRRRRSYYPAPTAAPTAQPTRAPNNDPAWGSFQGSVTFDHPVTLGGTSDDLDGWEFSEQFIITLAALTGLAENGRLGFQLTYSIDANGGTINFIALAMTEAEANAAVTAFESKTDAELLALDRGNLREIGYTGELPISLTSTTSFASTLAPTSAPSVGAPSAAPTSPSTAPTTHGPISHSPTIATQQPTHRPTTSAPTVPNWGWLAGSMSFDSPVTLNHGTGDLDGEPFELNMLMVLSNLTGIHHPAAIEWHFKTADGIGTAYYNASAASEEEAQRAEIAIHAESDADLLILINEKLTSLGYTGSLPTSVVSTDPTYAQYIATPAPTAVPTDAAYAFVSGTVAFDNPTTLGGTDSDLNGVPFEVNFINVFANLTGLATSVFSLTSSNTSRRSSGRVTYTATTSDQTEADGAVSGINVHSDDELVLLITGGLVDQGYDGIMPTSVTTEVSPSVTYADSSGTDMKYFYILFYIGAAVVGIVIVAAVIAAFSFTHIRRKTQNKLMSEMRDQRATGSGELQSVGFEMKMGDAESQPLTPTSSSKQTEMNPVTLLADGDVKSVTDKNNEVRA